MTATNDTPTLAFYPRLVTPCPGSSCRQGRICSFCTEEVQSCTECHDCPECVGGWIDLPATTFGSEWTSSIGTPGEPDFVPGFWDQVPAPAAKVEVGDEVLHGPWVMTVHDVGENGWVKCHDADHADEGYYYGGPITELARVVRPGSDWEIERGRYGLEFRG